MMTRSPDPTGPHHDAFPLVSTLPSHAKEEEEEEEEEDGKVDLKLINAFASKIQYQPNNDGSDNASSRPKIVIPKRGEKDFEPLQETANLQETMLQRSREALFNALSGVRGGNSKSISHALLSPSSPYPHVLVTRGHLLDTMGISVRPSASDAKGKAKARTELLPEEALYLLERGTLQIWVGLEAQTEQELRDGLGTWHAKEWGVRGAVEMSVMEGFALFIGKDGLSWERYQAYAYLKRLGYTVQRTERFLPAHFNPVNSTTFQLGAGNMRMPPFQTWWLSIPNWTKSSLQSVYRVVRHILRNVGHFPSATTSTISVSRGSLLDLWRGWSYAELFQRLRLTPAHHGLPPPTPNSTVSITQAKLTAVNPYLPFFHVWKPVSHWSKAKWQLGSTVGLQRQSPDYVLAIVEARRTPMPSIEQLAEVFAELPDAPKGPVRKAGPQYERTSSKPRNAELPEASSTFSRLRFWLKKQTKAPPTPGNPMGILRNGDRALIVAVNDSGNTGWVRFGRSTFSETPMI